MRSETWGILGIVIFIFITGCSGTNKLIADQYRITYSLEVDGTSDAAISDGLPEGLNANTVSNAIHTEVVNGLANRGLIRNADNKNLLKLKYSITYFGHKWKGGFKPKYILVYNLQLIDMSTGNIIASDKNDKDDTELLTVIDDISDDMVNFVTNNIK